MTPSQKLDEIFLEYFYPDAYCGKKRCEKCRKTKVFMDEAKKKIIELFVECVPEERVDNSYTKTYHRSFYIQFEAQQEGWNACRTETIKNMEKLKGQ